MDNIVPDTNAPVIEQQPVAAPVKEKPVDQMAELSRLLKGEKAEPTPADANDGEGNEGLARPKEDKKGKASPKNLHDAAKLLGIEIEDFYKLEVGLPDATEKFTLSQLKDSYAERESIVTDQLAWGEERAKQEGEMLRARNEFTELMSALPPNLLKPEILSKVREKHDAALSRERALVMQVIPEWSDDTRRQTDLDGMKAHLEAAGFPAGYLKQISDHRTMRYIRENFMREKRINDALARVANIRTPSTPNPSTKTGSSGPQTKGSASKGRRDPAVSQIANLLRGSK